MFFYNEKINCNDDSMEFALMKYTLFTCDALEQ